MKTYVTVADSRSETTPDAGQPALLALRSHPETIRDKSPARKPQKKKWLQWALMLIRRSHLYFGILLMPWALLYGISGYLFNHPTHFQDSNLRAFGPGLVQGTFLEGGLDARRSAEEVVGALNTRFGETRGISLDAASPPSFASDFIFASAETERETIQLLLYRDGSGGTLRTTKKAASSEAKPEAARFDIAPPGANRPPNRGRNGASGEQPAATKPANTESKKTSEETSDGPSKSPLHIPSIDPNRLLETVTRIAAKLDPQLAEKTFRVTSAPDLQMRLVDENTSWNSRYNPITGAVSSKLTSAEAGALPTWRRFLTRLHTAHGYPLDWNARWVWAIIVDVMAFVMVFWGISGLIMWWQIKRTRPMGTVALVISLTLAIVVGSGMLQGMR